MTSYYNEHNEEWNVPVAQPAPNEPVCTCAPECPKNGGAAPYCLKDAERVGASGQQSTIDTMIDTNKTADQQGREIQRRKESDGYSTF